MRYTFTSHRKYNDGGTHKPLDTFKGTTAAGLNDCRSETEAFAKEQENVLPENTRSNPADRVKRFREGLSWSQSADTETAIRSSVIYKKSAVLFFHCVLSSVYGYPVILKVYTFDSLNKEEKYPGREYFLKEMLNALYGDENERQGMQLDRQKIIYLYQKEKMIGLMSAAGPIPAIEYDPPFIFKKLPIDDTVGTKTITESLGDQDKQIVKLWLMENAALVQDCDLYRDISSDLEDVQVSEEIKRNLTIARTETEFRCFPYLENYDGELLADSITIVPLSDANSPLGYNMPTQKIVEIKEFGKVLYYYGFIPPLSEKSVEWTRKDSFEIRSFTVPEKGQITENNKLVSVQVECKIVVDGLEITVSKVYKNEQLRYVKQFPTFSVYGPVPKFGWIAQRNVKPSIGYKSPILGNNEARIDGLTDIELEGLCFELIEDNYLLYCGEIPQWVGVRGNGNWLGGLPLRVDIENKMQDNWKTAPAFVHKKLPPRKKIKVAVDIGSSRSVVVFWEDLMKEDTIEYTLIEDKQLLNMYLTSPLGEDSTGISIFETTLFQPQRENREVKGKTPLAVFRTAKFSEPDVLLYRSGKLAFLDPKQLVSTGGRKYDFDIKARMWESNEKKQAMKILVQGLLTVIIERAVHLGCFDIDIRTAYLIEQHNVMVDIWNNAKKAVEDRMPKDIAAAITVNVDLCLPESLAIANRISHTKRFETGSGAAFVDIGDFSTDIALFKNTDAASTDVTLLKNFSIHFGGAEILLRPIWDYLCLSDTVTFTDIFDLPAPAENPYITAVVKQLSAEREKPGQKNSIDNNDEIKSRLLCLMNRLKKINTNSQGYSEEKKLQNLQNLFDLGYLAEIIILKRLIKNLPHTGGRFNIHLFGGGSSFFKEQKHWYNWSDVLGRPCETYNKSNDGNILALGLLWGKGEEIHATIRDAGKEEKNKAEKFEEIKKQAPNIPDNKEDLKQSYVQFVGEIQKLKAEGWFFWSNEGEKQTNDILFNVKKTSDNQSYELADAGLWEDSSNDAMTFAKNCIKDCITDDDEIFKVLFAYKIAYSFIMRFYSGKRNIEEEKSR